MLVRFYHEKSLSKSTVLQEDENKSHLFLTCFACFTKYVLDRDTFPFQVTLPLYPVLTSVSFP